MKELLHVGCSHATLKDVHHIPEGERINWREYRLDVDASVQPDYVCSMLEMYCVPPDKFDMVYASHALEHVKSHEVVPTLHGFMRVLKSSGATVVAVPDLDQVAKHIVEKGFYTPCYMIGDQLETPIFPIDILYGWTICTESGNDWMQHKTGFTEESLRAAFEVAGYVNITTHKDDCFTIFGIGQKG